MTRLRIVLADDHTIVRAGIRALLDRLPDVEVVGEASDGREALALIERQKPDILLTDIAMAGMSGIEAARRCRKTYPSVKVIILSMYANEEYVTQALRAGAAGYLLKDAATIELELALKAAAADRIFLSPSISRLVIDDYVSRTGGDAHESLTPRQREILQLIAEGRSTKEIAYALDISVKTVETHRAQLMERLDIHDIAGIVRYALRVGLIHNEL